MGLRRTSNYVTFCLETFLRKQVDAALAGECVGKWCPDKLTFLAGRAAGLDGVKTQLRVDFRNCVVQVFLPKGAEENDEVMLRRCVEDTRPLAMRTIANKTICGRCRSM